MKSRGITATTVRGAPSILNVAPSAPGLPAKSCCQSACDRTISDSAVSVVNSAPIAGFAPSSGNIVGVTAPILMRCGSPRSVTVTVLPDQPPISSIVPRASRQAR